MLYPILLMTLMVYIDGINDEKHLFRQVYVIYYNLQLEIQKNLLHNIWASPEIFLL